MPCCDTGRNIQKYKGAAASTLQDVTDNGNTTTGDIITTSGYFIGDGSKLTNVTVTLQETSDRGNTTSNTIQFTNPVTSLTTSGNVIVAGNVTASKFYGDGTTLDGVALSVDLTNNVTRISILESNLADNVTRIGNLESNLVDNSTRISTVSTDLISNASRISTLEGEIQPVNRGGTGLTSFVSGDLIYANGTSSFTNLAANSSTQGYFLRNDNGTPTWADVAQVGSASPYSLIAGTGLSGGNFNGSSEVTWTVDFGVVATTSNLNSNVTRIYNLETNLNNNSARITTITNDLTNNVSRIGNLETNLTNNSSRITTITNDLTNNVSRIGNLETNLTNNSSRITTVTNDLTNNVNRIGNLETNLTNNSSRITTVTNDLTNNVNRIGNLETNLTNNSSRITTVTNDLTNNVVRIGNLETNLTNNSSRITTVTNDLTNNDSRISTLENETQPVNRGGTNFTDYSVGDILYASGTTTLSKLSIGSANEVLTVSGGTVSWQPASGGDGVWTQLGNQDIYYNSGNVGIANTAPIHTLDVGSNVAIIDDGIDKLYIRGNVYSTHDIISLGTIHCKEIVAVNSKIKNSTVVTEAPTRQVRLI